MLFLLPNPIWSREDCTNLYCMAMVRAHASIISFSSLAPTTPCRPLHKGLCAAVFCSFLAPGLPQVQETGLHLYSNCPIECLPISAPFSEFLSAFLCQIEVPQLQRPLCSHVVSPLFQLFFPQVWAIPSHAWNQLDFFPLSSSVRPFKQRNCAAGPNFIHSNQ